MLLLQQQQQLSSGIDKGKICIIVLRTEIVATTAVVDQHVLGPS